MILLLAACTTDAVDWHGEVRPALNGSCVRCHTEGGQGPGDFTDLDQARTWAPYMVEAIDEGSMPPPAADPSCNDYLGSEHLQLPEGTLEMLQDWIDHDMPEGDPEDAPDAPAIVAELADPDLVVTLDEPYTPAFPDEGNEYRCFVLEHGQTEDFFITKMAPVIDNLAVVHHVVLFAVEPEYLPPDNDVGAGFDCIDNAFIGGDDATSVVDGNGMIAGWGPGAVPTEFVDDAGLRVKSTQKLILQMHYYESDEAETFADQSGYAFNITDEVDERLLMAPLGISGFQIPANTEGYTYSDAFVLPVGLTVHSVFPHMHQMGRSYEVTVDEDCMIRGDYDFDNQLPYTFTDPVEVEANARIEVSCTWDNDTDEVVRYGERTDEEMCFAFAMLSLGG